MYFLDSGSIAHHIVQQSTLPHLKVKLGFESFLIETDT
jgi:hypothetical protein